MRSIQPPESASVLTEYRAQPQQERYGLHLGLFLATFVSMVYAGGMLVGRGVVYEDLGWTAYVMDGLRYAVPFLLFLTVHEFGHYLAARKHGISVSLPYYIPIPLPILSFGTFGAVIRIREPMRRTRQLFDVGAAGPLAGFVVALGVLILAIATLPGASYLLDVPGHEAVATTRERNYPRRVVRRRAVEGRPAGGTGGVRAVEPDALQPGRTVGLGDELHENLSPADVVRRVDTDPRSDPVDREGRG